MARVAKTGMGGTATTLQLGSTLQVDLANEVQKKDEESGTEVRLQRVVLCLREGSFCSDNQNRPPASHGKMK